MKSKPCERPPCNGHRNTRNRRIIEEFIQSGERCALLEGSKYRDAVSHLQSISASIKLHGYKNVEAHMRNKQIYLVRNDMGEDKNEQS